MSGDTLDRLFAIRTPEAFEQRCMDVFRWQAGHCAIYRRYLELLGRSPSQVHESRDVPFLPISFFKTQTVVSGSPDAAAQAVFTSSGTTGSQPSRHHVRDLRLYERSLTDGFTRFYGAPDGYTILALTPSPLERPDSSLVYMVERLMRQSRRPDAGFFMRRFDALYQTLRALRRRRRRTLLIGLTYALLDFAEQRPVDFPSLIVMETGGMKGTRDELPLDERRRRLRRGFGSDHIHAEYGMTELLSQAYSTGDGLR
ncbi:MAG: acyltransferase, partial [Prevotellaceae bacterium]|nr:acyltransferase [Prevotellaceae bacterium]